MNIMQKDIRLAREMGHRLDVPLPTGSVANEMLSAACEAGMAKKDFAALFHLLAGLAGVRV
jgi:3-hydroxyisobutyrate dehydrogenase-like beta-hydroxyacid dehydrogenase